MYITEDNVKKELPVTLSQHYNEINEIIAIGINRSDYLDIVCPNCGNIMNLHFLGKTEDAVFNEIRFNCSRCDLGSKYKIEDLEDHSKKS